MRTVKFKTGDFGEWRDGMFHQWGLIGYNEVAVSRAIVEDKDGKIFMIEPWYVQFTDKPSF